ncbi:SNF2-related protein [Streptomyces echinatus]|uniref:SNF2-related protein n=1 Tax=Streptomyces echinatus TaxID=67293 RepID=UPI00379E1912
MSIGGVEPPLREEEENRSDAAQPARADGSGVLGDVPAAGLGVAGEPGTAGGVLPGAGPAGDGEDRAVDDRTPSEAADGAARGGPAGDPVAGAGAGVRGGDLAGEGAGDGAPGDVAPPRFRPESQRDLAPAGQGERARANLAALETLRVLEREQRPATEQEQRTLARWSGWGALPVIFNPPPARAAFDADEPFERAVARWDAVSDLREQIRELLTEDEWAAARRNTINAHYTDADLVRSIWGAVRGLGFIGGRVLEPGSGSGNFIGFAPILTSTPVQMTGVEVEPTTAAIARHLYPDAEIITSGLEEVPLADGGFDGVVGNVPFGRYKRFDKVHNADLSLSIHDHFVLKSLYATRPGGVVALITSRYTMDAEKPDARERMYQLGDLVGAVRLPARAHAAAAGTDVVTDVLFLRRRMPGEEPGGKTWLTSRKRVLPGHNDELAVNAYFDAHPEYVLGELRAGSREWGPEVAVVGRTDQAPAESLAAAAVAIAVEARAAGLTAAADQRTEPVQTIVTGGTEGALGLDAEGNPTIIDGGRPVPLEIHPDQRDQLVQLIRLKGLTLKLYETEADTPEPGETPQLAALRAELRVAWRDYRKKHPPLTKPRQHYVFTPPEAREQAKAQGLKEVPAAWKQRTAFAWIDDDPDASLLFGLEEWDERTGKGTEQKVLLTRVLEPRILPARANSHEDAIALAMEYDGGRLDMSRVASLLGLDEESAAAQCADAGLAYRDPLQDDAWEPRHRYLSGNVRAKLAAARERAAEDPTFQGNVSALERVQPADLAPSEIKAKIGAPWIPVEAYNDFLAHLGFEDASVLHAGGTVWEVRGAKNGDLARTEWGTSSRPTQDLFSALLRQADSTIQVTYRDNEGRTYVDKAATDEAQEKARLIAEAFEDWVWADETRAANLAKIYNEQFNNLVLPEYSGSALTLPGLISGWTMKEHQNAAIRRIVNEPTALLAHVVGAGKTATMAAGAMELCRTGLAKKPCLIVPNHMLKQWSREFRQLYPNAKILAITASDLNKKRRAKFMGRIAGGDWDAVILTHEAFNRVPLRPDTQRNYLDHEMKSLRDQLDIAAQAGMHRNTVKQIEESLANAEAKLQQQIESMGDDNGVYLEDTGVDYVFLDEAHEYKNLRTVSAIPGAAIQGSAKATKLHMVLDYLRTTNESNRVATLATGTPIANSVTEAYVLKRYLAPQILEEMGLDAFDNWAATFGEVVSQLEPDPKGDGYKYKARFSRFFNVPELMAAYRTFADVQMAEDLDLPTPPVLENEDGQRGETVLIPPTPAQRQFIKELPHKPWVRKPGGVLKALGEGLRASVDLDLVDATEALRNLGLSITADPISSEDPAVGGRVLDMEKVADLADAAATDMRSLGGSKEMGSKIPYAAEKIAEIWQETKDIVYPVSGDDPTPQELPGGLQLVFLDEGTPGSTAKHAADLYADLRDELVQRGMPRESIRFIHEAATDRKKEKLFADCRSGRVRVLVGSTQKMGTGTNIQDRAVALHHLSYPWRPADMAQRDGRIERRGNLNAPWIDNTPDHVRILYYITERTFDEFRLTTLARKARFIGQIQRKDFSAREIEDIGADAINLGMLSALASGDPAILQLAEATAERARLQGLARSWDRQQDTRTQQLGDIDDFLARADVALEGMRAAAPNRRPTTGDDFAMTVNDATYRSRDAAANALGARMVAIAKDQSLRPGERIPVGTFGGQDFHAEIAYGASGRRQLRLRFAWGYVVPLGQREDRAQWQASSVTQSNGRGAIQSLEHFLNHLDDDLDKLEKSAESLRDRREEITGNLRPKDENPYRIQARSKEREEKALGKLVVANEKEAALAERVERAESVNEEAAEEVNEELEALREHIANLRKSIADEHEIQARARGLAQDDTRPGDTDADPGAETTGAEAPAEPAAAAGPAVPDGSGPAEPPASVAEQQGDTAPAAPQDQPDLEPSGQAAGPTQATPDSAAPEGEAESSPKSETPPTPGNAAPSAPDQAAEAATGAPEAPALQPEPEQHTGPSPAMAHCAAVLRYYEPLLRRHKLSGRDVVAYIDRPGVGFFYDPDNPLPELIHQIGKVAERVGGSYRVSYNEWVNYQVGERRQQQSDDLTNLNLDLLTLYQGETEPLFLVDLDAILAAPPGTVIELPSEAQIEAEEAAAARIVIDHDAEGTEVRNTPRGGDQRIRDALNDLNFNWSRRQQKWYQRRNTPFEDRDTAVRGLRAAFERLGVAYTYNGPDPAPQAEDTPQAEQETATTTYAPATVEAATQSSANGPGPAADGEPAPGTDGAEPASPATTEPENVPAAASDTNTPEDDPEDADDSDTVPEAEEAVIVQTPDGPGTVIGTDDGDLVLVTTQSGTRVWERGEIQWPDGATRPENADRTAKERQNAADAAQASTAEGVELRYGNGNRLVDLDTEAGHGTVVDADGAVIGWVRARIGDDGRRYWWAQDARGGAPDDMPFHEALPPSAGVPAIRAAGSIRSALHAVKEPAHRGPIPAEYAAREVRLTTAQVRELRRLVLDATYSDGTPIEPPEWVASHRKYVLNTGQMQALGDAAQAAADAFPGVTAEERRTARVLHNAAERFHFEVYDTARWRATIPPIGERDPYARPYQPRPRPETPDAPQETANAPAPAPQPAATETQASAGSEAETAPAGPQDQDQADTASDSPTPDPALTAAPAPGPTDTAPEDAGAEDEEEQLDLFPSETPEAPAPARRPGGRRRSSGSQPAIHPGTEGGPEDGHLGVYGHAGHGECDRCGTPDTDRYTMVWAWHSGTENGGAMAAECGSCVELTTGLSYTEYRRLADVAEARRGGRRIVPTPYAKGAVAGSRTAENEWTYVHQPTGKRYRLGKESDSGYRGFVLRDLYGISQGTGISTSSGYELAERAALGRTAQAHPNSSDDWVFFGYRSSKLTLHEGESVTPGQPDSPRHSGGPFEHGPRWDITIGATHYQVEMVYQQGQPGEDGHRLEVTAPDGTSARYAEWDGVLEWARERVRAPERQQAAAALAAPLAEAEEALTAAEGIREVLQRRSTTSALVQAREAWVRARAHYEAGRLTEADGHLAAARSHAILARFQESAHADFRQLKGAVRRFHDAVDEVLYPGGAGWRPAVGDYVRSRQRHVPDAEGFWMKVTAIGADGIHVQSGSTGDAKTVLQPTDLGPHADLTWQEQPFRAPGEPRASDQERRAHLGMPPQVAPEPGLPEPAQTQAAPADLYEEQLDLFAPTAPEAPAPPASPENTAVPGPQAPGESSLGLVDGESLTYLGDWDGRYEITLPGTSYLLFLPSIEYRRTKFAVASNEEPDSRSPKRLRRFEDATEIMPWVRAHASNRQTGYLFRDGAWTEAPETTEPRPPSDTAAAEDGQLPLHEADDAAPAPDPAAGEAPAAPDASPAETAAPDDAPTPDQEPAPQDQEEAVADEPEPTSVTTDVQAVALPVADLPAQSPAQEAVGPAADVEDPPEPQPFTESKPLAADSDYQLELAGLDGQGPTEGVLRHGAAAVAAVRQSASGEWFARLTVGGMPADVTALNASPQEAAHQGAILFSALTGTPYGGPPVAAESVGMLSRADRLRRDLRDAAQSHLEAITVAAARVYVNYPQVTQFQELSARLTEMATAVTARHDSRQMAVNLTAVQQAVNAWGGALPVDAALDERQFLAWPLGHLLYDGTRLHGRLQATLDTVQAERAAAQEQAAAASAPAEPVRDDSEQETPTQESVAASVATDPPAPRPDAPEDSEMAPPARPATPEPRETPDPAPIPATVAEPGEDQPAQTEVVLPPWFEPSAELPLFTGPPDTFWQAEDRPVDVVSHFAAVQEAWDEHVPAKKGTGADLFDSVQEDLQRLEELLADVIAKAAPAPAPDVPPAAAQPAAPTPPEPTEAEAAQQAPDPQHDAGEVNAALLQADGHAPALRDLPEWQRIQTVRGAFGNLMRVMRERAGEHFDRLMGDGRVTDFVRRVSIRACEKVAGWAQAAADRLRRDDEHGAERRDLPSVEALLRLGDAAGQYSSPRRGGGSAPTPPPADRTPGPLNVPAMREMGEALARPMPGVTKRVSTAAARGRSTTAKRTTKKPAPGLGTEQSGHLRRDGADQQQIRKPNQR